MTMQPDLRLIVTDLDGTLIGHANEFPLYTAFRNKVNELRAANGAVWAACTGRSRGSFNEFFYPMRSIGIHPEFIILRHAYIHRWTPLGYLPRMFWNLHIAHLILRQRVYARDVLRHWREMVTGAAMDVRMADLRKDRLRLQFDSQASAVAAAELLGSKLENYSHLKVFTYTSEVDVRPVPFTKGLAVFELARHLGIGPDQILAIGNGHNDISMFAPTVAAHTGCPANSQAEVMQVVHDRGGHIARAQSLTGVMEILDAYTGGAVSSSLPAAWVPPAETRNPHHRGTANRQRSKKQLQTASFWLVAGIVYVTILVFAYFGLIPFADKILKPYEVLSRALVRVLEMRYSRG